MRSLRQHSSDVAADTTPKIAQRQLREEQEAFAALAAALRGEVEDGNVAMGGVVDEGNAYAEGQMDPLPFLSSEHRRFAGFGETQHTRERSAAGKMGDVAGGVARLESGPWEWRF